MDLRERCTRCRHPRSFHGKGSERCKATGCKAYAGQPCPGFVSPVEEAPSPQKG